LDGDSGIFVDGKEMGAPSVSGRPAAGCTFQRREREKEL